MGQNNFNFFKVSEVELKYRTKFNPKDRPRIKTSRNCYDIFLQMWSDNIEFVEEFNLLLLNRSNYVLGFYNVSKGGVHGTVVDVKLIYTAALLANASAIIVAHNHPSGELKPSQADINLTQKLKAAGKFLDISFLDHLIVSAYGYYSFADEGKL